ncbi:MAG: type II secretory pathway component ExeA-like protein [Thiothrix sp.]|nr:MAG: type II secretory pathway component ExeA-like protein [Thiothrix sp.]
MYLEHFQLISDPFRLSPDSAFFYPSLSHTTAKNYMEYVLWSRDSFIVITGEIGTGKTTLIQKMLDEAGPRLIVARLHQTQLNEVEFLQALLDELGVNPFNTQSKVELLSMLNAYLKRKYEEGETVVVIIDEAQNLSARVLEEIRLLSGFDSNREKLLNIFLVGQPELKETLAKPELEQLVQRIRLQFHLEGLGFDEVRSYIRYRLAIASAKKLSLKPSSRKLIEYSASTSSQIDFPSGLIGDELMGEVIKYTGGIPRLINTLCDTTLLSAYAKNRRSISKEDLSAALDDLQWKPYVERFPYKAIKSPVSGEFKLFVMKEGTMVSVEGLSKDKILVGRSHLCDIKIDQKSVSGKHFQLVLGSDGYTLEDLKSTNGTYVSGDRVDKKKMKDGDTIEIGTYTLKYKVNKANDSDGQVLNISPKAKNRA